MDTYLVKYTHTKETLPDMAKLSGTWDLPDGLEIVGKYSFLGQLNGFVIVECNDQELLAEYCKNWRHMVDLEVLPLRPLK